MQAWRKDRGGVGAVRMQEMNTGRVDIISRCLPLPHGQHDQLHLWTLLTALCGQLYPILHAPTKHNNNNNNNRCTLHKVTRSHITTTAPVSYWPVLPSSCLWLRPGTAAGWRHISWLHVRCKLFLSQHNLVVQYGRGQSAYFPARNNKIPQTIGCHLNNRMSP